MSAALWSSAATYVLPGVASGFKSIYREQVFLCENAQCLEHLVLEIQEASLYNRPMIACFPNTYALDTTVLSRHIMFAYSIQVDFSLIQDSTNLTDVQTIFALSAGNLIWIYF